MPPATPGILTRCRPLKRPRSARAVDGNPPLQPVRTGRAASTAARPARASQEMTPPRPAPTPLEFVAYWSGGRRLCG